MNLNQLFEKSKSVNVAEKENGTILITINRKSRFIRKDAEKLLKKLSETVIDPGKISIKFNAPLCSKAKVFLQDHKIKILD